jgi:phage terminase small subunit
MPGHRKDRLTPQQARFVDEYVIDNNASGAAVRAGYSKKYSERLGYRLLATPKIALAVAEKKKAIAARNDVSADRVIQEIARIAFADTTKVVRIEHGRVVVEETENLDADHRAAVSEISETTTANGGTLKVKLHDKVKALELLSRYLGILNDKLNLSGRMEVESRDKELEALLESDPEARRLAAELYSRTAARRLESARQN